MEALSATVPFIRADALFLAFLTAFMLYFYLPFWRVRKVPGPPAKFPVGHLPLLAKHGPDVFRTVAKEYGPIFRFHMGRQPLVIVADAELCKEVGIKKFKDIRNRSSPPPTVGSTLHHDALFLGRDSTWSSMRNTVIPLYQPGRLATLIPTMQSYVDMLLANIGEALDRDYIPFSELSLRMAIDIIGKTAFGVEFGLSNEARHESREDDEMSEFLKEYNKSMEYLRMDLASSLSTILGMFLPCLQKPCKQILKRIPGTMDYKTEENERKLCRRIDKLIADKSRDRNRGSLDFLAALLNARDRVSHQAKDIFADNYIRALMYEHLIAGTKTTAFTVSSIVYLVSSHRDVEEKLVLEIDSFGTRDQTPNADELQNKFPYLDQVIKEAMRFYLVSPLIAREASQQVEIGGHLLPKGTYVWLAPGVLAKDASQFPDPDVFRPERFDPACEEERNRHAYAHIPFGIGPRVCLGQKFALQQIKLTIISLYRHYVFRHSPLMESPLEFEYDLVLGFRHGVKLHAIKRKH